MPTAQDILTELHAKYADARFDNYDVAAANIKADARAKGLLVDVLFIGDPVSCHIIRRQLTPEEAVEVLQSIEPAYPEEAHASADWVLLASVPVEVADAYSWLEDNAPWWVSA